MPLTILWKYYFASELPLPELFLESRVLLGPAGSPPN